MKRNFYVKVLVFARDNYICQKCGFKPYGWNKIQWLLNRDLICPRRLTRCVNGVLQAHHIIPLSKGGLDTLENQITLCYECHLKINK